MGNLKKLFLTKKCRFMTKKKNSTPSDYLKSTFFFFEQKWLSRGALGMTFFCLYCIQRKKNFFSKIFKTKRNPYFFFYFLGWAWVGEFPISFMAAILSFSLGSLDGHKTKSFSFFFGCGRSVPTFPKNPILRLLWA